MTTDTKNNAENTEYVSSLIKESSRLNRAVINTGIINTDRKNSNIGLSPAGTNLSPLATAVMMNDADLVQKLLEAGAYPNYRNRETPPPIEFARNKPAIQNLLKDQKYQDIPGQNARLLSKVMEFREKENQEKNNTPSSSLEPIEARALEQKHELGRN